MAASKAIGAENIVHRIKNGIFWFKLGSWIFFALAGPALFAGMHNYLGVFMTGLISAVIGYFAFGPNYVHFRGSNYLRNALIAQGVFFALYGGRILFSPTAPWQQERSGTRTSLVLTDEGAVYGVEFTERSPGFLRFDPTAKKWTREPFPGKFVVDIFLSPDGKQIIAPEDRSPRVWIYEAGAWKMHREKRRLKKTEIECANAGGAPFTPSLCFQKNNSVTWIAAAGLFTGKFAVKEADGNYTAVPIPAPRPEALYPNPQNSNELWVAFWGSGVYRTTDRGANWKLMGLKGSEVTSLVVDFQHKVAYASTGSGIYSLRFE